MLRRDRRRERKRSAQVMNSKRQSALYATWAAIAIAIIALVSRASGASLGFCLAIFAVAIVLGIAGLVYAHFMWKREHEVLGNVLPLGMTTAKPVIKAPRHRIEDSHRQAGPARGATRIQRD